MPRTVTFTRDMNMMQTPRLWPHYPILPLKNVERDAFAGDYLGLLVAHNGTVEPVVVIGCLYDRLSPDTPRETYADFEAIHDAGWVVD